MKNLAVRSKITLGFLSIVLLFVFGVFQGIRSTSIVDASASLLETRYEQIRELELLKLKSTEMILLFMDLIIDQGEVVSSERMTLMDKLERYIDQHQALLLATASTSLGKQKTKEVIENFKTILAMGRDRLIPRINAGQVDEAFLSQMDDTLDELGEANVKEVDKVILSISQELTSAKEDRKIAVSSSNRLLLLILALGLVLSGVADWLIVRTITTPISQIVSMLKDLAEGEGDLTQVLDEDRKDEMGELAKWFNQFVKNVRGIVAKSQKLASELAAIGEKFEATAKEINQTASEIAAGAERESAAMTEATVSINQISVVFDSTANKMREIKEFSEQARDSADGANDAVGKTQKAMDSIDSSSVKIVGIIKVITEIANQTNLLSLNAAIEAAKAGESGKGFAVVADEVRLLADRSSTQVKQIQELIDVSAKNVAEGKKIANDTAEVLGEIAKMVGFISQPIEEMSGSITEQKLGVEELVKVSEEITRVSETNASASQELAASTEEIAGTAGNLARLVEELKHEVDQFIV